jgi:glutamine---fructose-6-phosphate transaminase (isomerizing)
MDTPEPPSISHLEREIAEQPAALRRFLAAEEDTVRRLAAKLRGDDLKMLMLAARGSSDNAARYAQYVFGAYNALPVALAAPSLFTRYRRPPRLDAAAVIAVSQSGRSPDVVGVLAEANTQQRPTVAVTNDGRSDLAAEADTVVELHAGDERSVAATKTYLTSLAALALLSVELDDHPGTRADDLAAVPETVGRVIAGTSTDLEIPQWLETAPACAVIGRGFNYATAFETALKIKELTGVIAQPYSSADFLHGPVAAVGDNFPVILVAPTGAVSDDMAELVAPLRERRARLAVISDNHDLLARADLPVPLPAGVSEWVSPLVAVVPGQVLAWRLAETLHLDVDRPRGLRKITETR